MKQDRRLLAEHGTELMVLKPTILVQAAQADLKRKQRNADRGERRSQFQGEGYEPYAFHRAHVRKAIDARDLIAKALAEIGLGQASGKDDTRLIYSNEQLLAEAMEIA